MGGDRDIWNQGPGIILKTIDGGTTWTSYPGTVTYSLYSVYFPDANTGYASGDGGTILKTTDGGITWTAISTGAPGILFSIYFTDTNTGYAVGDGAIILKTIDGGATWVVVSSGTSTWLFSVFFPDKYTGYAVGDDGKILKTTDGGTTWNVLSQISNSFLNSVFFTDAQTGYVVGWDGCIVNTTNGGGFPMGFNEMPEKSNTLSIYPNPASTHVTIETSEIPARGHLSIINPNGQQLITRQISEPKTVIDLSALPSGVYFVRLTNDKTVEVKKFIKQ